MKQLTLCSLFAVNMMHMASFVQIIIIILYLFWRFLKRIRPEVLKQ